MGRLSSGNKSSPTHDQTTPPSTSQDLTRSLPVAADAPTTHTKVSTPVTRKTTQFLSFQGWRKRRNGDYTNAQSPRPSSDTEEHGSRSVTTAPTSRDKALPPTPPCPAAPPPLSLDLLNGRTQFLMSSTQEDPPCSTSVLVQSSLGLGLRGVASHLPASSSASASEINTIVFASSSISPSSADISPFTEQLPSTQHMSESVVINSLEKEEINDPRRRVRGVSLGPATLFGLGGGADAKGKEKSEHVQGTLSRKSSFWARKKPPKPDLQARPATAHGDVSQHNFAVVADVPAPTRPNFRSQKLQARDPVSRSFSERPQSYYPAISLNIPPSPNVDHLVPGTRSSTAGNPGVRTGQDSPINQQSESVVRTTSTRLSKGPSSEKLPTPRVRSQTNPPFLHRLSLNVFSSSTFLSTSPTSSPSSPLLSTAFDPLKLSQPPKPLIIPRPMENEESPEVYVRRLMEAVSKVEVIGILASSAEPFYVGALKAFLGRFNFGGDPLDIALRKLLLEIGLPKETQQIDRVIEGFAKRYIQCNPDLYVSEDHPYILAFSLIMLHTDAFNKSNKHKMTKQDYIKNTRLPGVAPEMLEYFYDNIVFAPFIFIEDPLEANGQHDPVTESGRLSTAFRDGPVSHTINPATGSASALKTTKIDPYYMIINDLLSPLRIDVEDHTPLFDPFNYEGTSGKWDEEELVLAFANAQLVEVGANNTRPAAFFGLAPGGSSSALIANSSVTSDAGREERSMLRVTKVGLMHRKDDLLEGGKKPMNRKWRSCGVALMGSQLLFSRDLAWVDSLVTQAETDDGKFPTPPCINLKVDELLSLRNAIAVYDKNYTKHRFTFRLVLFDGRHLLLKVNTEIDMNQWISRINYASAFKSAGVRMRLLGMSGRNMHLTGVAAATSHLHDLQNQIHSTPNDSTAWGDNAPRELLEMLSGKDSIKKRPYAQRKVMLKTNREAVELEDPVILEAEKTVEFKDTFDQVKADLAAETWAHMGKGLDLVPSSTTPVPTVAKGDSSPHTGSFSEALSQESSSNSNSRLVSRAHVIETKIAELDDRLTAAESHLDTHMRFVHNVATLRPFQKASRDRIVNAVQMRAGNVMQLRLDIARMRCHRNVLHDDMIAENRIWKAVKDVALQAAKETLQSRHSQEEVQQDLRSGRITRLRQRPESSICESFHTAIDFGPDWPSSDDLGSSFLGTSWMFDSPRPSTSGSFSSFLSPEQDGGSPKAWKNESASTAGSQTTSVVTPKDEEEKEFQHEKFYTAQESPVEEAEAWNKTRCAQRVSLVRVPSNLELFPANKRLTLSLSTTQETER